MTALEHFRAQLHSGQHLFSQTLAFIAEHYDYQPAAFRNGTLDNPAGRMKAPASCSAWPCSKG